MIVLVCGLLLLSCRKGEKKTAAGNRVLRVVTTTGVLADAVRRIGAENFKVTALMSQGDDPRVYEADEEDSARLAQADIIVYNGLGLEARLTGILSEMSRSKAVIAAGELLPKDDLIRMNGAEGTYNPYIWFDPDMWATVIEKLGRKIARTDLLLHDEYLDNAASYASEVRSMYWDVLSEVVGIPKNRRFLVTSGNSFAYFGRAYNIEVIDLREISGAASGSREDPGKLADFIADNGIRSIFVDAAVPGDFIESLRSEAGMKGCSVIIGKELYSDVQRVRGASAGNYLDMMKYDVGVITGGLKLDIESGER